MNDVDTELRQRILADNIDLHSRQGYPEFYDRYVGIVRNPWERRIFAEHITRIVRDLKGRFPNEALTALDLGAGTGNLTLMLLARGVATIAVDISSPMLERLAAKARRYPGHMLKTINAGADDVLAQFEREGRTFHLVAGCSVLHHLPDYLHTIALACKVVKGGGGMYFAHEPMRKDTVSPLSRAVQRLDFKLWRLQTHLKRLFGLDAPPDTYWTPQCLADYWDLKAGCDQAKIARTLRAAGFTANVLTYDSKRSRVLDTCCRALNTATLFAVIASSHYSTRSK